LLYKRLTRPATGNRIRKNEIIIIRIEAVFLLHPFFISQQAKGLLNTYNIIEPRNAETN
jgi:hypothetical protein